MIPRIKDDLITAIRNNVSRRAIIRALEEGTVENLGGFETIQEMSGYLVRVTSRYGREWIVGLLYRRGMNKIHFKLLPEVPWEKWLGVQYPHSELINGDNPLMNRENYERKLDKTQGRPGLCSKVDRKARRKTNYLAVVLKRFGLLRR